MDITTALYTVKKIFPKFRTKQNLVFAATIAKIFSSWTFYIFSVFCFSQNIFFYSVHLSGGRRGINAAIPWNRDVYCTLYTVRVKMVLKYEHNIYSTVYTLNVYQTVDVGVGWEGEGGSVSKDAK